MSLGELVKINERFAALEARIRELEAQSKPKERPVLTLPKAKPQEVLHGHS